VSKLDNYARRGDTPFAAIASDIATQGYAFRGETNWALSMVLYLNHD